MIEFCSRKRMVLGIFILIGLSVVTLFIENQWSSRLRNMKKIKKIASTNVTCKSGKMEIVEDCVPCMEVDMDKRHCKETGYRRKSLCDNNTIYTSCSMVSTRSRNFWIFETCMVIMGGISYVIVRWQQNNLNKQLMDKINKQIAAGI